jgi:hypothetical protein
LDEHSGPATIESVRARPLHPLKPTIEPKVGVGLFNKRSNAMDVGFIGLGRMGLNVARNLCTAGDRVTVYGGITPKAPSNNAKKHLATY